MASLLIFAQAAIFCLVLYFGFNKYVQIKRRNGAQDPPGPPGVLVYGNAKELKDPLKINATFRQWALKYGEICSYSLYGKKQVLISSERVANALLAKRGDSYSDRGSTPAMILFANGLFPGFQHKTDIWRKQRKMIGSVLSTTFNRQFEPVMDKESKKTLLRLLDNPEGFYDYFRRYSFGILTAGGFGVRTEEQNSEIISRMQGVQTFTRDAFRLDRYLCNMFPWVLELPSWMNGEREYILGEKKKYSDFMLGMQSELREDIAKGTASESLAKYFIENQDEFGLDDLHGAAVFHNILGAGSRSPPHAMLATMTSLMFNPQWLEKMQQEIDRVVGDSRLPETDDLPNLPLVRAVMKESMRVRSLEIEVSVPHKLRQDDWFEGYFFAAGTSFQVCLRTIFSDPELYPDAETFNPGRWVEPGYPTYREPLTTYPTFQGMATFGHGRRACPGTNLAERSLCLLLARIAWAFNVKKPIDSSTGKPMDVVIEWENQLNPAPKPFPCEFEPRSEDKTAFIRKTRVE